MKSKEEKIKELPTCLRKQFPYGMIQDMNGKVVLFNRDYEALTFGGKKEFEFNPRELKCGLTEVEGRFFMTEDGGVYVGSMFFLQEGCYPPSVCDNKQERTDYLLKFHAVMAAVIGTIGNAYENRTVTPEQEDDCNRKLSFLAN